jgi:outer membrane murein-binding lipoprotein Lpp
MNQKALISIIVIAVIFGGVFISGCIGDNKPTTPTNDSLTNDSPASHANNTGAINSNSQSNKNASKDKKNNSNKEKDELTGNDYVPDPDDKHKVKN